MGIRLYGDQVVEGQVVRNQAVGDQVVEGQVAGESLSSVLVEGQIDCCLGMGFWDPELGTVVGGSYQLSGRWSNIIDFGSNNT